MAVTRASRCASPIFLPRSCSTCLRSAPQLPLDLLDEQRQRGLRVGRDVDVGIHHVLEVLVVALDVEAERRDVDELRVRRARRRASARPATALHLEVEDDVRRARIRCRRADDATGKFTRSPPPLTGACSSSASSTSSVIPFGVRAMRARSDARVLGRDQQAGRFAHGTLFSRRRRRHGQPRNLRHGLRQRAHLQLVIQHDQHRLHRRGHRNLVGADRRFGERRQARPARRPISRNRARSAPCPGHCGTSSRRWRACRRRESCRR